MIICYCCILYWLKFRVIRVLHSISYLVIEANYRILFCCFCSSEFIIIINVARNRIKENK